MSLNRFTYVEKVIDFFPICSLHELVVDGKNGFIFNSSKELREQLLNWFYGYPGNVALNVMKDEFAKNLKKFQSLRWSENWKNIVLSRL